MSKEKAPTKSRKQFLDLKAKYPDTILFFRMGDFYEMFDHDAEVASKALDLVLTARKQRGRAIPMCGVPHHSAEGYIAKLISKGHKVAVCEQIGNTPVNGLMPRDVVRVYTAGTVIEPSMLQSGQNNYLVGVIRDGERAGLAYADITTGQFGTTELSTYRELVEELARLEAAELLVADNEHSLSEQANVVTHTPTLKWEESYARSTLKRHFGVQTLSGFGCENSPLAVCAAGGVLSYLMETQKGSIDQIQRLRTYHTEQYMSLDRPARRNLELTDSIAGEKGQSLFQALNKTVTPMGSRLLRDRITRPLIQLEPLKKRLDEVTAFYENTLLRADLRASFRAVGDLERLSNRVLSQKATPRDIESIALTLEALPELQQLLVNHPELYEIAGQIDPCVEVKNLIQSGLNDPAPTNLNKMGVIRVGYSAELDGILQSSAHAREWISNLEPRERDRTGIDKLKVGYNKVFGYYIEVSRAKTAMVPDDYIRKQTLVNSERYITPELKEYETLVLNAEGRIIEIEARLFRELNDKVGQFSERLLRTASAVAELDVASSLAEVATNHGYSRPELSESLRLEIVEGRHPAVERTLSLTRFVPNNTTIGTSDRIHVITGPNMSGKSTYLRQVALITLMAQVGSYVPAEFAHIGLVDRIFTRIGAHDELHAGRSTFMVEMVESAEIMNHATQKSLLILDEIGRGTSTYDGLSIAWAMIEFLHNHPRLQPRTFFATHYHELTGLADTFPLIANYNVAVSEEGGTVAFLHKIIEGGADQSYGIHVAQLAGLPRDLIQRANEILADLEANAVSTTIEPSHLKAPTQAALFPEASPILDDLNELDLMSMNPLEALNTLYEWKKKYGV